MNQIFGLEILPSPALPIVPTDAEVARRIVRHGLARVLHWLGEPVGPSPDEKIECLLVEGRRLLVSHDLLLRLRMEVDPLYGTGSRDLLEPIWRKAMQARFDDRPRRWT